MTASRGTWGKKRGKEERKKKSKRSLDSQKSLQEYAALIFLDGIFNGSQEGKEGGGEKEGEKISHGEPSPIYTRLPLRKGILRAAIS